jgi:predicted transcriptional regulator
MSKLTMLDQRLLLQTRGNKRDKLAILSDILSHATIGVCKTELMCKVGLSSAQMDKYMPVLVKAELLEVINHSKKAVYLTTNKGQSFLDVFGTLVSLLDR